jgi:hypothetical protein
MEQEEAEPCTPITVAKLIEELQALVAEDPAVAELVVLAEGCDCTGEAAGIEVVEESDGWIDDNTPKRVRRVLLWRVENQNR